MPTTWKCPNHECEATEFEPEDVTSLGDAGTMWLCAGCNGTWTKEKFERRSVVRNW
jgi:hypothetical protein